MTDVSQPTVTPPAVPPPPSHPPPLDPWYKGVDAEIIGHANNKGWKLDDPKEAFAGAVKQARELERHFGVPPEQLLKMPKPDAKTEDIKAFWLRLGAAEPNDYDFSAIKFNGEALDDSLIARMRDSAARNFVPKDKALGMTADFVKWLEDAEKSESTEATAKFDEQMAALKKSWGPNLVANTLTADDAARRLGFSPDDVKAMGRIVGVDRVAEMFRRAGSAVAEPGSLITGGTPGSAPMTQEGAVARLEELKADPAWTKKLVEGNVEAKREFDNLIRQITGITDTV